MKAINIITFVMAFAASGVTAADTCNSSARDVVYDKQADIYLSDPSNESSDGEWTRIIFPPARITSIDPSRKTALYVDSNVTSTDQFSNHLQIKSNDGKETKLFVYTENGNVFELNIHIRNCGDRLVKIGRKISGTQASASSTTGKNGSPQGMRYLASYMAYSDEPPVGYSKIVFKEPEESRKVMDTGSVKFYITEQWVGPRFVGSFFKVVNTGRTSFEIDLSTIDFSSSEIVRTFGVINHLGMLPVSRILAPNRKYQPKQELNADTGLLFIVSERGVK